MTLRRVTPTFRVKNARKAEAFYRDTLGFKTSWEDDPGDGHPIFVEMSRGDVSIHLSEHEGDGPEGVSVYVDVDDARGLHGEVTSNGGKADAPESMPWGHVVFVVTDPDGNVMRFGSPE
ncbi:MAG: bleomycin resistance protein [Boseongicola sp.]